MIRKTLWAIGVMSVLALTQTRLASAQFAVIDVSAIARLIEQIELLQQQLKQAQAELDAMTGSRGMQGLLSGTVRNYLPTRWNELAAILEGTQNGYGQFAAEVQAQLESNAVLTDAQLANLSEAERREVDAGRRSAAALQALSHVALANSSERFEALQTLIDAIGSATDQKAILDLQARIQAEQTMLMNEQNKLQLLYQVVQAEELARQQRAREKAIAGIGSLRTLPPMGLVQ